MIYRRRTSECKNRWYKRAKQEGRDCSETHDINEKMYFVMDDASNEKNNENIFCKGEELEVSKGGKSEKVTKNGVLERPKGLK